MESQTIIITGMSGIDIEKCLNKFISNYRLFQNRHSDKKPILLKLDTEIENAFYDANPTVPRNKQIWKDTILKHTYPVLKSLWRNAFERVKLKVDDIRKEFPNKCILINLHSCYYHNRTQEYIPLIDLKSLASLQPNKIVTFIDDIFEIHHRLIGVGGIYHDERNISNTQMILRLLRLLDWRAKEAMLSRYIADQLGIENYLFAVKHSFDTFYNLIFEDYPKIYLSHPITEVRRLEDARYKKESDKIMSEITEISNALCYNFTVFLPTTIDEFRILSRNIESSRLKNYYSVLTKRWENELYKNPRDFLYINSHFEDRNELWKSSETEITSFDNRINHLLEALSDFISDQVTVRDYALVEQSDILVIYRPVFNGNASNGVREELRYYKRLIKDSGKEILCFIYCPREDIDKFFIRQFELKILNEINEEHNLKFEGDKAGALNLRTEEREELIRANGNKDLILDILDKVLDNHQILITVKNEKTPLSVNNITLFKNKFAEELIASYNSIKEYEEDVAIFETNEMTIEQFVSNILNFKKD